MKLKKVLKLNANELEEQFWLINVVSSIYDFKLGFDSYKYKELGEQKYIDADYIKRLFFEGKIENYNTIINLMYGVKVVDVLNLDFRIFIRCLKTVKDEIERDLKEQNKLSFFTDEKTQMALKMSNAESMNQFGLYNSIDGLANGDKSKWDYFKNLKYKEIRLMLSFNALSGNVRKKFEKNYTELNKTIK